MFWISSCMVSVDWKALSISGAASALSGTTPSWTNDLDLSASIDTSIWRGNVIDATSGFSATGGGADSKNNLEGIFLSPAQHAGTAIEIRVLAATIAADALNPYASGTPRQDFALVCHNCRELRDAMFGNGFESVADELFADGFEQGVAEETDAATHRDAFGMDKGDDIRQRDSNTARDAIQRVNGKGIAVAGGVTEHERPGTHIRR